MITYRLARISLLAGLLFLLSACGGGGGSEGSLATNNADSTTDSRTGTVGLLITDGPTDDFQALNVTVLRAELLSDDGSQTIFEGNKTFDLLDLENATEIFAISNAEAGRYNKIRLILDQIELVMNDGSSVFPDLPGNGKLDLNPQGSFFVDPDQLLLVQLDFDANKSILVIETGKGTKYKVRPVVFVKIIRDSEDTKLVRITGVVGELDSAIDEDFELCQLEAVPLGSDNTDEDYCVAVETSEDTSFFDDNGDPSSLDSIDNGDTVTALGRFTIDDDDDSSSSSSSTSSSSTSSSTSSSSSSSSGSEDAPIQLTLVAEVVMEQGLISVTRGTTRSAVSTDPGTGENSFEFEIDEASIPEEDSETTVFLQQGTRIYSRAGVELDASAIEAGLLAEIDGVRSLDPAEIRAAVIMLVTPDNELSTQLTGTINSVEEDNSAIIILTDGDAEERCADVSDARVFMTELDSENTIVLEEQGPESLAEGQRADAFGDEEVDGCLKAHTVIYQSGDLETQPI